MIGFVVVDDPSANIEAVEDTRYPGKSKALAADLIEEIKRARKADRRDDGRRIAKASG